MTKRRQDIKTEIKAIPPYPDDQELLVWAKKNYPALDTSSEKKRLEAELETLEFDLSQMKEDD